MLEAVVRLRLEAGLVVGVAGRAHALGAPPPDAAVVAVALAVRAAGVTQALNARARNLVPVRNKLAFVKALWKDGD